MNVFMYISIKMTFLTSIQAAKLTDFEKMIVKMIFDRFNTDRNEEITAEEIRTKYIEMKWPLSDLEITNIIGKMDTNSSGTIDFDEYCEYWTPDKDPETKRSELTEAFQVLIISYYLL